MASNKVKGLTIQLSADTTGVNKAMADINKSISSTEKELKSVDKLLKFDPKNTTLLAQKQQLLTSAINDTKKKLDELNKVQKQADIEGVDKQSKGYRDLERQIETAKQKLNGYNTELKNVSSNMDSASKSSISFGDIVKANVISDFIINGIKTLANAVVQLGKSFYNALRSSGEFADDVNTMAKKFNLSTKEIQQYIRASDLIDVEVETIAKSMTKLTKAMSNPSKSVNSAFKELGILVRDSSGELRDSNQVFNEVIQALGKIENETKQDALALEIFGKSSAELGPLINGGADELKKFNDYLEKNNLLLSQEELDNLNKLNDSFDTLQATFDATIDKVMAELAPVITPLIDQLIEFVNEHQEDLLQFIKDAVDWLSSEEAQEFYDGFMEVMEGLAQFLLDFPAIKEDLEILAIPLKVILTILNGIVDAIKFINENPILQEGKVHNRDIKGYGSSYGMNWGNSANGGAYQNLQNGYNKISNLNSNNVAPKITINVKNTGDRIDTRQVKKWAKIINDELGNNLG